MDCQDFLRLKNIVRDWARGEQTVRKAFIFGSRAQGTQRRDSDLDVAIEMEPAEGDSNALATYIFEKDRLERSLASNLPVPLHLELLDGERTLVVDSAVRRHGVLVYDVNEP